MEQCFQAWQSNKNICSALVTDNIHYKTFSYQATKQKICFTKAFDNCCDNISVESCFQAWLSNKNIDGSLNLTDNINWIVFSSVATK